MIRNSFLLLLIIFIFIFFFLVYNKYISDENIKKVYLNRSNINEKVSSNFKNLETLKNDTNNVIEYNSGYDLNNQNKSKRNFWELFKN